MSVRIVSLTKFTATARGPGEISGPAAKVSLQIVNNSSRAVSVANVVVNVQDAKAIPLVSMTSPPVSPFSGSLAARKTASAIYVFELPKSGYSSPLAVSVSYSASAPVATFTGALA